MNDEVHNSVIGPPSGGQAACEQILEAARLITSAKRRVLYVGGGVLKARATAELKVLAELTGT